MTETKTAANTISVGLVKIPVSDLARSAKYYREALGLTEEFAVVEYGWAQYATGGVPLCLYVPGKGGGLGEAGKCNSLHLITADIQSTREAMQLRGARVSEMRKGDDGYRGFDITDPDGNVIQVVESK
ncbi:MAG: VOC family protein [Planctomycetes bacterium]|nr:VOC family protein [Planctomycetota bacterium]